MAASTNRTHTSSESRSRRRDDFTSTTTSEPKRSSFSAGIVLGRDCDHHGHTPQTLTPGPRLWLEPISIRPRELPRVVVRHVEGQTRCRPIERGWLTVGFQPRRLMIAAAAAGCKSALATRTVRWPLRTVAGAPKPLRRIASTYSIIPDNSMTQSAPRHRRRSRRIAAAPPDARRILK